MIHEFESVMPMHVLEMKRHITHFCFRPDDGTRRKLRHRLLKVTVELCTAVAMALGLNSDPKSISSDLICIFGIMC